LTTIDGLADEQATRSSLRPLRLDSWHVRRINVEGVTISAVVESGSGRPVVFLHGNSSNKTVWARQIDLVRSCGRAVLAPDLPGHGKSENSATPGTTYSFPGYAFVIGCLLDTMELSEVDVVGWSLGGHIGLELLATDDRIRSLLIVGTPPARPCAEALDQAFYADEDMQLAGKGEFTDIDALAYGMRMMGGREYLAPALLADIKRTDGNARKFMFTNALAGVGTDQRQTVETIDKPLCVVHGELDPFVKLEYLRSLRYRALWNDRVHVIRGAGHAPHWQCPDAFNRILLSFLDRATFRRGARCTLLGVANSHAVKR
jgi:pimeloyl-ACP methyl ester carboxylesterase